MNNETLEPKLNSNLLIKSFVNFIVPLVCLLLCILQGIFIIFPYYKTKPAVKNQISEKQHLAKVLESKLAILNKLSDFKNVLNEGSQLIDKVLVSEASVPQLLDEIYQIATNTGLAVKRLNYSFGEAKTSGVPETALEEVNVSLGVDGSYDQLIVFLQAAETAARVVYVPTFRYTLDADEVMSINLNVISPFLYVKSTAVTDEPVSLDITDPKFTEFISKLKSLRFYEFLNKEIAVIEEEKLIQ